MIEKTQSMYVCSDIYFPILIFFSHCFDNSLGHSKSTVAEDREQKISSPYIKSGVFLSFATTICCGFNLHNNLTMKIKSNLNEKK